MAIYLSETTGNLEFEFPSMPESIDIGTGTSYQSYKIIGKGGINIPKGVEVTDISWDGVFFGRKKRRESIVGSWESPEECKDILSGWQENGTVLELIVDEAPVNMDVTISNFSWKATGGFGNIEYSIAFNKAPALKVYTTTELKIDDFVKTVQTRPEPEKQTGAYTVVKGDNLWKIARKFYGGSGAEWEKIYVANQEIIENTARRYGKSSSDRGHWIYAGCVLTIP
ncbi:LysM peptidoglycan-binding domain-containing protein [Clostridium sp. AM58-1XD]|uniref:LysM peptidoglycan-binding domain-containing protein n=1 Tax=Clostridium sp. AM58-1XD TaxID=2292307 RepID=UPI000E4D9AA3|nr:LysM peptidoglycan-binding domain-containing protein [Clostridium sp. AM58-1XD]RGY95381.1 LysM peptidoglycan-binding domain-containing protein [Clostridium sp. AM58-1XD]